MSLFFLNPESWGDQLLKVRDRIINPQAPTFDRASDKGDAPSSKEFDSYLSALLAPDPAGEVNEEELFAALTQERIKALKGDEAAKSYQELFAQKQEELRRWDGKYRTEDAAMAALKGLVASGVLSADEGDEVYSYAFKAAQLDDNHEALFDSIGGPGDPTRAVATLEAALLAARTTLTGLLDGTTDLTRRSLGMGGNVAGLTGTIAPDANGAMDGAEGFLWKPVSENQQRLAVLFPKEFTYNVATVRILDSAGNEIEKGIFSSFGEGGPNAREKYNFSRRGEEYPPNLTVEMVTKDGRTVRWDIPDPGRRYD